MAFFGGIAAILCGLGFGLSGFMLWHYWETGSFSPHKWAGISGATLMGLGVLSLMTCMIGDMLNRHRIYLEEILYHTRAQAMDDGRRRA